MGSNASSRRLYMIGVLEGWRESTKGADEELAALQAKIMTGELRWIGRDPTQRKARKKAQAAA